MTIQYNLELSAYELLWLRESLKELNFHKEAHPAEIGIWNKLSALHKIERIDQAHYLALEEEQNRAEGRPYWSKQK